MIYIMVILKMDNFMGLVIIYHHHQIPLIITINNINNNILNKYMDILINHNFIQLIYNKLQKYYIKMVIFIKDYLKII